MGKYEDLHCSEALFGFWVGEVQNYWNKPEVDGELL